MVTEVDAAFEEVIGLVVMLPSASVVDWEGRLSAAEKTTELPHGV